MVTLLHMSWWGVSVIMTLLGTSIIVTLPRASLWFWLFLGPFYDCDFSWGLCDCGFSMIVTLPLGLSMIVALLWASILVLFPGVYDWHFLRHICDCGTCYGLSMIVTLPGSSLWCDLGASMIMTVPWASLWLCNFLGPLCDCEASLSIYDCGTFEGLSMIVAFSRASLWLWHFLGPVWLWHFLGSVWLWHFLGHLTSWGLSVIVKLPWA